MKHFFINLTNGIEYLESEIDGKIHFIRLRSTTIERKDYIFLLMDLDHNFLLHLALGKECILVDYGTRRKNSKTCYTGVPLIKYLLGKYWFGIEEVTHRTSRSSDVLIGDVIEHFKHIYDYIFTFNSTAEKNKLKTKLNYFKRFIDKDKLINLSYLSSSTINDGNNAHYIKILKTYYNE